MTFVLIDYKGGSAFGDCVDLPHTVGMVSDLDTHLVERALASLAAELRRREHLLAEADAKDIEDYTDLRVRDAALPALPRLVLVIDEFASMVRELPDFVTGLVSIAQRGRSLGIHLLLATQRPSGVVSPEIRANTNLRIALRVTDATESTDVIDAPDAARISKSTPGRAYVRLGHSSLVPFQAGRVGGRRPGTRTAAPTVPWVVPLDWPDLGRPLPRRPAARQVADEEVTDLSVLVGALGEAARQAGVPAQPSPWLPALPDAVLLDDLPRPAPPADGRLAPAAYAVEDLPALQVQRPAVVDLATFTHLLAVGAPRSGRSQLLRTLAGSLARTHSCEDVHLYGIDCGNGALLPLAELPHCGAVVSRSQGERASRLVARLAAEVERRQGLLGELGVADITEQRRGAAPADRLAARRRPARPVGGLHHHAGRARRRPADRHRHGGPARGRVGRGAPGHHRRPEPHGRSHRRDDGGQARAAAGGQGRLRAAGPEPAHAARRRAARTGLPRRQRHRDAGRAARPRPLADRRRRRRCPRSRSRRRSATATCRGPAGRSGSTCCRPR